jgi:hypothetical protein
VARKREARNAYRILMEKPLVEIYSLGKLRRRWEIGCEN